ncbi:hypothetical protein [Streptomyces sp. JB150]|uniref:hypothetical protein n=1 Tax=Streptomyces sp. JB150 TaxID=2714844 RepID=UPI00140B5FF0|nr:hypothetical protein [Streptomyces sp. JB150]QIJ63802.1 hypothetical protein G7Z13_18605 [Streptomyces sp. JB150]
MARGRVRRGPVAAVGALPALLSVWLVAEVVTAAASPSDYPRGGGPKQASCAEALAFGGARLPERAYDADCTVESWLDTRYAAEFRLPRADLSAWLDRTYPGVPRRTDLCAGDTTDLCLRVGFTDEDVHMPGETSPGFGAHTTEVLVDHESPRTVLVRLSAFTV